jgi:hypothetical protein
MRFALACASVQTLLFGSVMIQRYAWGIGDRSQNKTGDRMKILIGLLLALPLFACSKQGPLERIGEEIDEAVEDVRAGGETTGNKIDDAIDDVRKEVADAVE